MTTKEVREIVADVIGILLAALVVVAIVGIVAAGVYGIAKSRRFEACTKPVTATQYTCTDELAGDCWVSGGTRHPGRKCADLAKGE